ncbi:uncharacterized protein B0H18DRAFT_888831, partial [Fomitopsis serialis]|uniref:uncharacterized protein n=1 Tax=Fomitopsis serialis TaxID=139415 RepID=UPI00200891E8
MISLDILHKPRIEGGIGLLDIATRNEAIELTWITKYLDLSETRPKWAYVLDAILSHHTTKDAGAIRPEAQINSFLQSWKPATSGRSGLSTQIKSVLKTAKKHDVSFAAIRLHSDLKKQLPVWYHLGATSALRRLNNTGLSDCLRLTHGVVRLTDVIRLLDHRRAPNDPEGEPCMCDDCMNARMNGCRDPDACRAAGRKLLDQIRPKWHPDFTAPSDGLSLTRRRKDQNTAALLADDDVVFDPTVTSRGQVSEAFRAFVHPQVHDAPPAIRARPGRQIVEESTTVVILNTKEIASKSQKARKVNVGFAYFGERDRRNALVEQTIIERSPGDALGGIMAALYAAETVPWDAPIHLV